MKKQNSKKVSGASAQFKKFPVLIAAGEPSGDLLGGDLVSAMNRLGFKYFFGTGGESMREAGVKIIHDVNEMAVMGFVEAVKAYRRLKRLAKQLTDMAVESRTKVAILIDYPGFNLALAKMLHGRGIRVVFLVSPQIWAWHYSRIEKIRASVDLMLPLFAFEEEIYLKENIQAKCVGHPLVQRIPKKLREEAPVPFSRKKTIALLPGSRMSEVSRLLSPILESARLIHERFPNVRFLLAGYPPLEGFIKHNLKRYSDLPIEYIDGRSLRVMEASDLVILASGTATLETAWFTKPMIIVYRTGWINLLLAAALMRTRFVGMVNLLAKKQVAIELLQTEVTGENICREAEKILTDDGYRRGIVDELENVKRQLGRGHPADKAARYITEFTDKI